MAPDRPSDPNTTPVDSTSMQQRQCPRCRETMSADCFRKGAKNCVWCVFGSMRKRAKARYLDKLKLAPRRINIRDRAFVDWYEQQIDRCTYCGLTFAELKRLKIRRGGGTASRGILIESIHLGPTNLVTSRSHASCATWPKATCSQVPRHGSLARRCARFGMLG